ncbi:aldo/keto reductase [Zhongshania aquimaris]|uniref:aldo/keto reductase n=1 Tax=Zhongshania aquimaris TaxID=2857107 RepID=UPI0021027CC2|nr:aldo/keto reductase [Zhongshania aquimaris]
MTLSRAPLTRGCPEFSRFIAGFWRLNHWGMSPRQLLAFVEQCVELGVTTMDHAFVYSSEKPFGDALAIKSELRRQVEIVTKCGIRPVGFGPLGGTAVNHYDSSSQSIITSTENSLRELRTDYIDLLLIHRPDYLMHAEEIASAFDTLLSSGKVRAVGVSNFSVQQFALLQQACDQRLVTNQVEFSPYNTAALDSGLFEQCQTGGISPMLWSCLAGGRS